jgi:hypothetical protein
MRLATCFRSAIVLTLGFVLASGALATPARAETVPFVLDAAYDAHPTPDALCRGFRVNGAGQASGHPTGPVAWSDTECADVAAEPGHITIRDGHLTLTGESGDALFATYTGRGTLPDRDGFIYLDVTVSFAGGTGRFLGATGTAIGTAVANINYPATSAHIEGQLAR